MILPRVLYSLASMVMKQKVSTDDKEMKDGKGGATE